MVDPKAKQYLKTQIQTASPEKLLIMLYDGAIRFCEQAKCQIDAKNREEACQLIVKTQRIISELLCSLKSVDESEDITRNLAGLYKYMYLELVQASVDQDKKKIDEIIGLMRTLRGAWGEAIQNVLKENTKTGGVINREALAKAQQTTGLRIEKQA